MISMDTKTSKAGSLYDSPAPELTSFRHSDKWIFGTMLVSAFLSLLAAFVLSIDAWKIAENPDLALSCDINAVLSCGDVARSWQATLFGFPNSYLGLMFEPMVITLAAAGLAGVKFPRWIMLTAQTIYLLALIFALWLFSQSMLVIGALCPWCLLITFSTSLVFISLTHYNIKENNLFFSKKLHNRSNWWLWKDYDLYLAIGWVVLLVVLIVVKYGPELLR